MSSIDQKIAAERVQNLGTIELRGYERREYVSIALGRNLL